MRRPINRTTLFNKWICNLTPEVRDILKILWKRGEIAPKEQFLLFSTIFCYLILDFNVKTGTRISLRDKRLFEISEVEITRVDCNEKAILCWTKLYLTRLPMRTSIHTFANIADPDVWGNEPSHQNLLCLPFCYWCFCSKPYLDKRICQNWRTERSISETGE